MNSITSLIIYLFSFAVSIFLARLYQNKNNNYNALQKFLWFLLIMFPPILISSIRYNVGTDYSAYVSWFNNINRYGYIVSKYKREPLYFYLNKLAYFIFREPWGIFFVSSFIIHFFIFYGLDFFKDKISISFGLFVYYLHGFGIGLNGIRQMLAISIIFYSLRYIYNKNFIKYIIFIIIASLFHNTALICLLFYFLVDIPIKSLNTFKSFVYYISIVLSPLIVTKLLSLMINLDFLAQYSRYVSFEVDFGIGFLLFILPVIIPIFIFKNSIINVDRNLESIVNLLLLNIPFRFVGYLVSFGHRMAWYTLCVRIVVVGHKICI